MIPFTDVTGLLGSALALTAVTARVSGLSHLAPAWRRGAAAVILAAALIPLGGLPLAGYLRGVIGDLSVTSLLLLVLYLARSLAARDARAPGAAARGRLQLTLAAVAIVFYPLALGWGGFDPYRLGYGSHGLLVGLLGLALWAAARSVALPAAAIALAVLAWSLGWYESPNLWDYLMDPLLAAWAVSGVAWQAVCGRRRAALQ
jgi:hypothetical protein